LLPGEAVRIRFQLDPKQLALYGLDGRWRVEPGRIEVMIGASSADIRATGAFEITSGLVSGVPAAAIATNVIVDRIADHE